MIELTTTNYMPTIAGFINFDEHPHAQVIKEARDTTRNNASNIIAKTLDNSSERLQKAA